MQTACAVRTHVALTSRLTGLWTRRSLDGREPPPLKSTQVWVGSSGPALLCPRRDDSRWTARRRWLIVTLIIQTDRPLRSPAQLLALVQAIEMAAPGDEKHWQCGWKPIWSRLAYGSMLAVGALAL